MTPLRIALVCHIRHPIGQPFQGGMEAHNWHLMRALRGRGHHVTLFASGDSDAGGPLRPVVAEHYERTMPWHRFVGTPPLVRLEDGAFAGILDELAGGSFDVVHNHCLHRFPPRMARRDRIPMVTSLHVPPFDALQRAVHASMAPWCLFTVCSEHQRSLWWPDGAVSAAHVVYNGLDPSLWTFRAQGEGHAVWVGRITRNKGPHLAARAARRAGVPLILYGSVEEVDYFDEAVRPQLGGDVRYGGHLPADELSSAVGRASALLFTPCWEEPFGLVAAEAMACGVPVASFDRGAAREVVGDCGALAPPGDVPALAAALRVAMGLSRRASRERVIRLFTQDRMVSDYESLYRRAISCRHRGAPPVHMPAIELPPRRPRAGDSVSSTRPSAVP